MAAVTIFSARLVDRQPALAEIAQDARRHLPQGHAEVEQDAVAVGHATA